MAEYAGNSFAGADDNSFPLALLAFRQGIFISSEVPAYVTYRMKKYILHIYFALISSVAAAQNQHLVDSLYKLLGQNPNDTAKALALAELCFQFRFYRPDTGLLFGREAISLSRQIHYLRGETRGLSNSGFIFRDLGYLPEALDVQLKALRIAQENGFHLETGLSMIRLSSIYRDLGDFQKALYYLRRSFVEHEKVGNYRGIAISTMILGQTYLAMNQLDSALYYEQEAFRKIDSLKPDDLYSNMFRVMGDIYKKLNRTDEALQYYRQGLASVEKMDLSDIRTISEIYANIADIHLKRNDTDSAIFYAKQALANAESISSRRGISDASLLLSKIYDPIDNTLSYQYYKRAMNVRDSILNQDNIVTMQSITHEKEEYDRKLAQQKENYQDRVKLYSLIAGLGIILIVAVILYRNNRQKQQANTKLEQTLKDLRAMQTQLIQSEKMASLGELTAGIAHEIQNPLNFVNNFSEVNDELVDELSEEINNGNKEAQKELLNELKNNNVKIAHHGKRADSIVKSMLQHSRTQAGVKEPANLNAIADEYLRLAYHGMRAKDSTFNATLETELDPLNDSVNIIAQDIGRVLLNLFNNAFYAVAEKKKTEPSFQPKVKVVTSHDAHDVIIKVIDNGTGMSEQVRSKIFQPFFTTKPTGQGTGLGMSLSYDIITKGHQGQISVQSAAGEGSVFEIRIPA